MPDYKCAGHNLNFQGLEEARCLGKLQMAWCWLTTSVVLLGRFYHAAAAAALALRFEWSHVMGCVTSRGLGMHQLFPHARCDAQPVLAENGAYLCVAKIVSGEALGDCADRFGFDHPYTPGGVESHRVERRI